MAIIRLRHGDWLDVCSVGVVTPDLRNQGHTVIPATVIGTKPHGLDPAIAGKAI
jgi:hypothetical protein